MVLERLAGFVLLTVSIFSVFPAYSQSEDFVHARAAELFPYPFKKLSFIIPRFDRKNFGSGEYSDSYVVRGVTTFHNSYHVRIEVPLVNSNTSGKNVFGLSDIHLRFIHAIPMEGHIYFGYGGELVIPSATDRSLGDGKWQLRPQAGVIRFFGTPERVRGTALFGIEYRSGFAGSGSRQRINVLAVVPNIDYWAKKWYAGYYATWTYDFENEMLDIPLDVEFGYNIFSRFTLSGEYILPLLKKRSYNNEFAVKLKYAF